MGTCLLFQLLLPRTTASNFVRNTYHQTVIMLQVKIHCVAISDT